MSTSGESDASLPRADVAHGANGQQRPAEARHAYQSQGDGAPAGHAASWPGFEQAIMAGVATVDAEGRQTYVNPAFCEMVGWPAEELVGATPPYAYWPEEEVEKIQAAFEATMQGGAPPGGFELRFKRAGGARFDVLVSVSPLVGEGGRDVGWLATVTDISERKRAEEALRQSEAFKEKIIESSYDCIKVLDLDGRLLSMSSGGQALLQISDVEPHLGTSWINFWTAEDRAAAQRAVAEAREGGTGRFSGYSPTVTGIPKWWESIITPILDERGRPERLLAISRDITEQHRAEESLRFLARASLILAGSLDYETTLASVADLVVPALADWCAIDLLSAEGALRSVAVVHSNPEKVELAQELRRRYPPQPDAPTGVAHVIRTGEPEIYPDIPDALLVQAAQDNDHLEILRGLGLRSALVVPLKARGRVFGAITLILSETPRHYTETDLPLLEELARTCALAVDNATLYQEAQREIEERRRAEEALRQSEERYRLLSEITSDYVFAYRRQPDDSFAVEWMSEAFERITGYAPAEVATQQQWAALIHPDDLGLVKIFSERMKAGQQHVMEYRLLTKDGGVRWLRVYGRPVHDEETGEVVQILGAGQDITEKKQAEEEVERLNRDLKRRLDELQTLLDVSPVGLAVAHDPRCAVVTANPALAEMLGVEAGVNTSKTGPEADRLPFRIFEGGEEVAPEALPMQQAAATGRASRDREIEIVGEDGHRRTLLAYASPLYDEHEQVRGALGAFVDLTEIKQAEARIRARLRELELVHQLSTDVVRATGLEAVYDRALDVVLEGMGADRASLLLFDDDDALRFKAWRGLSDAYRAAVEGHTPWARDAHDPQPVTVPDALADPSLEAFREIVEAEGVRSLAFIPLTFEGRLLGKFMAYFDRPYTFADEELRLAQTIANHVAFAIEQKRAEQALRESEQRLRFTLEAANVGTWDWDLITDAVAWSDNLETIHGREPGGFSGTFESVLEDVLPEDRDGLNEAIRQALDTRGDYFVQYRVQRAEGEIIWVEARGRAFYDAEGQPVRMAGICTDITERKRAEEQLRDSMELFRQLVLASPVALYTTDAEGRVALYNERAAELWGRHPVVGEDLWCGSWRIFESNGKPLPLEQCPMAVALKEGRSIRGANIVVERPDGVRLHVLANPVPLRNATGELVGAANTLIDITEIKQAEIALRESETRFRQLAETIQEVFYITEPDGLKYVSPAYERLWGHAREELYEDPQAFLEAVVPEHRARVAASLARQMQGDLTEEEYRIVRPDGAERWVHDRAFPVFDEAGEVVRVIGLAEDLTARKEAEEALRRQTRALEIINEVNASLAAELELEKLVQAVTDAGRELSGAQFGAFFYNVTNEAGEAYMLYSLSGAPHEAFSQFPMPRKTQVFGPTFDGEGIVRLDDVTQDPRYGHNAPYQGMPEGHLPVRSYLAAPVVSRTGDVIGGLLFGHEEVGVFTEQAEHIISGIADQAAIAIENARLYTAVQRELVERRRAETRLKELNETLEERVAGRTVELEMLNTQLQDEVGVRRRAEQALEQSNVSLEQRNRELQDFAYVASHDLQEPLRKIHAFADLLRADYEADLDETAILYIERMQHAVLRMSSLIKDLLAFSRVATRGEPFREIDLNEVAEGVLADLEVRIDELDAAVDVADLPCIEADPMQMRQLLQNLIGNALKFHREDDQPRVSVRAELTKAQLNGHPQPVCRLAVQDNGIGFDEKYLDRIFSPFQRLHGRSAYEGTGMGLAICRRIAERHGGAITAESAPGKGATFVVLLPLRQEEEA